MFNETFSFFNGFSLDTFLARFFLICCFCLFFYSLCNRKLLTYLISLLLNIEWMFLLEAVSL